MAATERAAGTPSPLCKSAAPTLGASLALAAGLLLESGTGDAAGFGLLDDDDWEAEAALLLYSEPGRVSALEPVVSVRRILDTDRSLSFRLAFDTLSGASGSGAAPADAPQTFTRPSGNGSYTVAPGETPLDDTFQDDRVSLSGSWTGPVGRGVILETGASFSDEYDYRSVGANATLARGFDRNNRTVSLGVAAAFDTIEPVGGRPVAFQSMTVPRDRFDAAGLTPGSDGTAGLERAVAFDARESSGEKNVVDVLLGLTQVIDRSSLMQVNLGLGEVDGYQSDPYKFLSVVDASGETVFADGDIGLPLVAFENRPDSRSKRTLYTRYKRDFDGRVLDAAYRYGTDDWGIDSHTVELAFRLPVGRTWWEPALRFYTQSEADFFRPFLLEGELPDVGDERTFATSDYRLGALDAWTVGLTYGRRGAQDWSATIEYYLQRTREPDTGGIPFEGALAPDVDAILFRLVSTF